MGAYRNGAESIPNAITENDVESDLIVDPLLKYLTATSHQRNDHPSQSQSPHFDVDEAIEALKTQGYYHVPAVLTQDDCDDALDHLWNFVEDTSGGCVQRKDPLSWYAEHEVSIMGKSSKDSNVGFLTDNSIISTDPSMHDDIDPWPHTGHTSVSDLFQSLGAGFVLGRVRQQLADRIFEPLFDTRELLCSKEGFIFSRPLIVDLDSDDHNATCLAETKANKSECKNILCWKPHHLHSSSANEGRSHEINTQLPSEGHTNDQDVPVSAVKGQSTTTQQTETNGISKKQQNRNQRKLKKQQRLKDLVGLCHIQASISFTDQTLDQNRGGGHFLCYPHSHSTNQPEMGCEEKRIYANKGDVILWRSDLVHKEVAPSLMANKDNSVDGPNQFRAVAYCSMLPVPAVRDYMLYSLPKQKLVKNKGNGGHHQSKAGSLVFDSERAQRMLDAKEEELLGKKLESYKTFRTGDHRPGLEVWHEHRRVTMWNTTDSDSQRKGCEQKIPPRMLQRPRFRLGPPKLTVRQAELYGLLPYQVSTKDASLEKIIIRGVRFEENEYRAKGINGEEVCYERMDNGRFVSDVENAAIEKDVGIIPICTASMEVLMPHSKDGSAVAISGQDKYLGGMSSPCGRYIYGVPGHATRVVRVDVRSSEVDFIGPEYVGEFKWLRGVEIPGPAMGTKDDGSLAYPSGCCLALPCNSDDGCVLKIDPETSNVTTFISGTPIPNVEEGWLYHGGNLDEDGFVYAIPASAPRVMKIDPRLETTEYIGPEYQGKAKWYGGITGADGCIYGIPHNSTGVLKINPKTQEVSILAEGTLSKGLWKWHGGLASLDGTKIIGFPNNADCVLVIDVLKQSVYTVGDSSILRSGYHRVPQDGKYKYLGGALTADGKLAYLFPCDAEYCLQFNMETDEMKLVGPHLTEGENKFQNGFVGEDGCIYGIPQRASGVVRIIPPGVMRYGRDGNALSAEEEYVDVVYCGDDMVSCKDKFEGGVQGMDGKVYCIPLHARAFINIIPGRS